MTREALLRTPAPFTPPCAYCDRETAAPVVVGAGDWPNGCRFVRYACPACASEHGAGPSPEDEIT
ncbi:hypothetical protein AB0G74_11880 [Streptomyces sp. NPDC020875]|uniref:hypothetical protein n=1 Tax=Streptomyces sp. NPDC020875 TaxID=3154898 RepID=UPI0033F6758A